MEISVSEIVLIGIALWGMCKWICELVEDINHYRTRGEAIVQIESKFNMYHVLGIVYLLILMAVKDWYFTNLGKSIIYSCFVILSAISVYRAIRKQGLYENGICIPEQNGDLDTIVAYKWDMTPSAYGYAVLHLQVAYSNIFVKKGIKIIRWGIPNNKVSEINGILKALENYEI